MGDNDSASVCSGDVGWYMPGIEDDDGCGDDGKPFTVSLEEFEAVTDNYVAGMTFLEVRCCKICRHQSNELNPLIRGPWCRSYNLPCWPWMGSGPFVKVRGVICRVCNYTFIHGGFLNTYKTIDAMMIEFKKSDPLSSEFAARNDKTISLINCGQISIRCRGSKKQQLGAVMASIREKIVVLVKANNCSPKTHSRLCRCPGGSNKIQGRPPKGEGFATGTVDLPNLGKTLCVLLRKGNPMEFDVEVVKEVGTLIKETLDDGKAVVREGQQEAKYESIADNLGVCAEA